jgi:tetratricopeptide (TPR) repeat protein
MQASGQDLPLTNEAAKECQAKNFEAAKAKIEAALQSPAEKDHAYTQYVKGFIYKEIYKANEQSIRNSPSRDIAVTALEASLALDHNGEYSHMTKSALKYLAVSYYNDALKRSKEIDESNEGEPMELFGHFRRIMRIIDPASPIANYEKEIQKMMGERFYELWEADVTKINFIKKSADSYNKVIQSDSLDCDANYNLAIIFYNQGVYKIRTIDSNTDMMELIRIQDECVILFKRALPFMSRTFKNCPSKAEFFKGMMYINRALGKDAEYEKFKGQLEQAVNTGKLIENK